MAELSPDVKDELDLVQGTDPRIGAVAHLVRALCFSLAEVRDGLADLPERIENIGVDVSEAGHKIQRALARLEES